MTSSRREAHTRSERAAFEALYRRHYDHVFAYAARRTSPEAAPDIAAETFLVVWRRRGDVPDEPLPWLYAVARRVVANHKRSRSRRLLLRLKLTGAPAAAGDEQERGDAVVSAFGQLSERDRETLALIAWEELPPHEAALVAGCSARAFRARLHRARRRFRQALRTETEAIAESAAEALCSGGRP